MRSYYLARYLFIPHSSGSENSSLYNAGSSASNQSYALSPRKSVVELSWLQDDNIHGSESPSPTSQVSSSG